MNNRIRHPAVSATQIVLWQTGIAMSLTLIPGSASAQPLETTKTVFYVSHARKRPVVGKASCRGCPTTGWAFCHAGRGAECDPPVAPREPSRRRGRCPAARRNLPSLRTAAPECRGFRHAGTTCPVDGFPRTPSGPERRQSRRWLEAVPGKDLCRLTLPDAAEGKLDFPPALPSRAATTPSPLAERRSCRSAVQRLGVHRDRSRDGEPHPNTHRYAPTSRRGLGASRAGGSQRLPLVLLGE